MFPISKQYINCRCGLHLLEYQKADPNNPERLGIINSNGKFTSCHKHEHITKGKYNEVIPQIIKEFLDAGFINTQNFFEKEIDHLEEYNHLKKDNIDPNKITAQKTSKSNMIIRRYMPHIYEVEDSKGINLIKLWTKEKLEKAFKSLDNFDNPAGSSDAA